MIIFSFDYIHNTQRTTHAHTHTPYSRRYLLLVDVEQQVDRRSPTLTGK